MCHFSQVDRLPFPPFDGRTYDANMPVELFERIAAEMFPRARRVALGCAAEPMMHPHFADIVRIAGRYRVPDLWFPTNLLPLTEATAEAIVRARVTTVAVSIDGVRRETYERIRAGATWERLHGKLGLLRDVRRALRSRLPRLRVIFTWMRENRDELRELPAFAASIGAASLDVRYVSPTDGVDNSERMLAADADAKAELGAVAREAVRRGMTLASFPEFDTVRPRTLARRIARRLWRIRAGLDSLEHLRHRRQELAIGCGFPHRHYVIRASGAVFPCIYHDQSLGPVPMQSLAGIAAGEPLARLTEGLRTGAPIGNCATCEVRRSAMFGTKT